MDLLLGQLVYTSFSKTGFKLLASAHVPTEIQQAYLQHVVSRHWNSYNLPSGYQAVYLYQTAIQHTLFGWLYNEGVDNLGRSHVPYFICYYLGEPLLDFHLEIIFTYLQKGPVALLNQNSLSASLETMVIPDLCNYQEVRLGVVVPLSIREHSQTALKQRELLDLFVPINNQETVIELKQTYEQQIANLSFYTRYIVEGIEPSAADLNENAAMTAGVIDSDQKDEKNQSIIICSCWSK